MKTIEVELYSYKELSDEAKKRVLEEFRENNSDTVEYHIEECAESIKRIVKACELNLSGYSVGPYNQNKNVRVRDSDYGKTESLSGRRALSWLLKVLIKHGYQRPKTFSEMKFPGVCGFTGVIYDDAMCEAVWDSLMQGNNISKAFDAMGDKAESVLEEELEYLNSEECFLEQLDQDEEIYLENGMSY